MNEPSDKAEPYKTAALPLSYGGNNQLENSNIKIVNRKEKPRLAGEMFLDEILRFINCLFEHADGDGAKCKQEGFAEADFLEAVVFSWMHWAPPFTGWYYATL